MEYHRVFEPLRETKIGSKKRRVREIGGKTYPVRLRTGKRLSVRVLGRFEKMRVRGIEIPLYVYKL